MHQGCSGSFQDGKQVIEKIRMMGFANMPIANPLEIICVECGQRFQMEYHESKCPNCNMIYGVTPCHASHADNVMAAGKDL